MQKKSKGANDYDIKFCISLRNIFCILIKSTHVMSEQSFSNFFLTSYKQAKNSFFQIFDFSRIDGYNHKPSDHDGESVVFFLVPLQNQISWQNSIVPQERQWSFSNDALLTDYIVRLESLKFEWRYRESIPGPLAPQAMPLPPFETISSLYKYVPSSKFRHGVTGGVLD